MAVISFIAGCLFWWQFRHLDAEEDALNLMPTGHAAARPKEADDADHSVP